MHRRPFIATFAALFTPVANVFAAAFRRDRALCYPPEVLALLTPDQRSRLVAPRPRHVPTLEEWEEARQRFIAKPELEKLSVMTGIPVETLRASGLEDR